MELRSSVFVVFIDALMVATVNTLSLFRQEDSYIFRLRDSLPRGRILCMSTSTSWCGAHAHDAPQYPGHLFLMGI